MFSIMKSAIGEPASRFRGIVHKATSLVLYFSFNSMRRHIIIDSHFASGVTGFLETSFVPIIKVSMSIQSSFYSSIILMTWATEAPPKEITVVCPTTKISSKSLTRLSPMIKFWLPFVGRSSPGSRSCRWNRPLGVLRQLQRRTKVLQVLRSFRMVTLWLQSVLWDLLSCLSRWVTGLHAGKERFYPSFCPVLDVSLAS